MTFKEFIKAYLNASKENKRLVRMILESEKQEAIVPIINEWMALPETDRTRERLEIELEPYL